MNNTLANTPLVAPYAFNRWAVYAVATAMMFWSGLLHVDAAPKTATKSVSLQRAMRAHGFSAVPLTRGSDGHYLVESMIDGQKVLMLIDTGAPTLVIDRALAGKLGLPILKPGLKATGLGGAVLDADGTVVKRLQFKSADPAQPDPMEIKDIAVVAMDLRVAFGGDAAVQAILGVNLLQSAGAILDLGNLRLYLPVP